MSQIALLPAEILALFGLSAAALSIAAYLPYIRDTLRGTTHPHRASWLIWTVLSAIAFCTQLAEGAQASLWFAGAQSGGTALVFLLSLRRGSGATLSRSDERVLWLATIGLVIWYFTKEAHYALAMTITLSLLGGTLTVLKSARRPNSETLAFWMLGVLSAIGALVAVGTWDPVLLAYPAYLFTLNGAIIIATMIGRARERVVPQFISVR